MFCFIIDIDLPSLSQLVIGQSNNNNNNYNNNGFGVGLPVVKQITNDFGGEIKVINLKSPTKFEIKLPKYLYNNNYIKSEIWNQ